MASSPSTMYIGIAVVVLLILGLGLGYWFWSKSDTSSKSMTPSSKRSSPSKGSSPSKPPSNIQFGVLADGEFEARSIDDPITIPPMEEVRKCVRNILKDPLENYLGSKIESLLRERCSSIENIRFLGTDSIVTMDYNPSRVNLFTTSGDRDGIVLRIAVG